MCAGMGVLCGAAGVCGDGGAAGVCGDGGAVGVYIVALADTLCIVYHITFLNSAMLVHGMGVWVV